MVEEVEGATGAPSIATVVQIRHITNAGDTKDLDPDHTVLVSIDSQHIFFCSKCVE